MRRILIVFTYENLAYSPTTLNLYDHLSKQFYISILSLKQDRFCERELGGRNITFVEIPPIPKFIGRCITNKITLKFAKLFRIEYSIKWVKRWINACYLLKAARKQKCEEAIGIDFDGMWIVQRAFDQGHMVSLEIYEDDPFRKHVKLSSIKSVMIQTEERYNFLFPADGPRSFFVQNAPVFSGSRGDVPKRKGLIFCGTAVPEFGIFKCVEFIDKYPDYTLTIQGAVPNKVLQKITKHFAKILSERRLQLSSDYIERENLSGYLERFEIGFCIYDSDYPGMNTFNYRTAPSGKLFAYYAAGIPVIGSDIPGLRSVSDFGAGVLMKEFTPKAIRYAIDVIVANYDTMSSNAYHAAKVFSFDRAVAPFSEFLARDAAESLRLNGARED